MSAQDKATGLQLVQTNVWTDKSYSQSSDRVACEVPVALAYNCISYVVMMATPTDLEDFALGFSLCEGILDNASDMLDIEIVEEDKGITISMIIAQQPFNRLKTSTRNMTARTGCGLCGTETLEQAIKYPPQIDHRLKLSQQSIQRSLDNLTGNQILNRQSGSYHAAAWSDLEGNILLLREDVGRHNALDKLLGALQNKALSRDGFVTVTSRLSYEMVTKAAFQNVECLVGVSAATSLAIDIANQCGLTLVGFARSHRHVIYTHPQRLEN